MGGFLMSIAEMKGNPDLVEEYENTFDNEEKISHAMKLTSENFTIDTGVVYFDSLLIPDPIKNARKDTYTGLSTSVAEIGIVTPIHVMITEGYAEWVAENPGYDVEDYDGPKYILIDGFRRIWAGYKSGLTRCNAVIWDFEDKDKGSDLLVILARILNKSQKQSWLETWNLYNILMSQSPLTENTLDYLLHLDSGDSSKLRSIMENADRFPEPKEDLLANKKTLQQAFNMLEKMRKELDKLAEEDNQGISEMEQADGVVEKAGDQVLSDEEVKEVLEMGDSFNGELSDEDFGGMLENEDGVYDRQTTGDRHPLDPVLKAKTMERDQFSCTCCGFGEKSGASRIVAMSVLQSHHKISVSNSGPDSEDNITTICMICHTLTHICIKRGLKLGISKGEFDSMPDTEKERYKRIMQLARTDWEAGKRLGKNKERMSKDNSNYSQFKMPGTDLAQNMEAVKTLV